MTEEILYELLENNPDYTKEDIENIFLVVEMADEKGELGAYDVYNTEFYQSIIDACDKFSVSILTLFKLLEFRDEDLLYL